MRPIKDVGSKVSTEKIEQIHEGKVRKFYTSKIEVNNRMLYINDSKTISGIVECESREQARKVGRSALSQLKEEEDE